MAVEYYCAIKSTDQTLSTILYRVFSKCVNLFVYLSIYLFNNQSINIYIYIYNW